MPVSNLRAAVISGGVAAGMLGLAFAAAPLYETFCRVTGFGGTTQVASKPPANVLEQTIDVRFDANVSGSPLIFRPLQPMQTVRLGEHGLAFYEVSNPTARDISVIAGYNVTPHMAGIFFNKLECFCFEERIIAAGETRKLPVVYFIDPQIIDDRVASRFETVTLSYTFFDSGAYDGPRNRSAAESAAKVAPAG